MQLFNTIHTLLQRTQLRQVVRFKVLVVVVLKQIFDPARMCMLPDVSEELKLAAIQCLEQLFRALSFEARTEFYTDPSSRVQLAQVVYMALHLVEHDRYRQIRVGSLRALQTVFNVHPEADFGDVELREAVADRVFTMLPKCCAVLLQCCDGDVKQPMEMKSLALATLGKYLCLVFEDYSKMGATTQTSVPDACDFQRLFVASNATATNAAPDAVLQNRAMNSPESAERSSAWLEAAAQRLRPVFVRLMKLAGHDSRDIRLQLSDFVADLFAVCTTAVRQHFDPVLQIAIVLSRDEDASVADRSQRLLADLQTGPQASAYLDQLDALFHRLLITCPRVLATGSDAEQFALLVLLTGVLSAARLRLVLATGDTMERFCTVLLFAIELDDGSGDGRAVAALRESQHQPLALGFGDAAATARTPPEWRTYKHLRTERLWRAAEELCLVVGRSAGGEAVFEQMLQRMRERSVDSAAAMVVMQLMLAAGDGWAEVERAKALLGELMAGAEHWELDVRPVGGEPVRDAEVCVSLVHNRGYHTSYILYIIFPTFSQFLCNMHQELFINFTHSSLAYSVPPTGTRIAHPVSTNRPSPFATRTWFTVTTPTSRTPPAPPSASPSPRPTSTSSTSASPSRRSAAQRVRYAISSSRFCCAPSIASCARAAVRTIGFGPLATRRWPASRTPSTIRTLAS